MKRISGALLVLVAMIFLIQINWFTPVAEVDYKGYMVSDRDMEKALLEDGAKDTVLLTKVKEQESIYEQFGKYYIGDEHTYVDERYPLYFNDDTAIQFVGSGGVLYDSRYDVHEVLEKSVLSDGVLYDRFQVSRDEEEYLFYGMENGIFINTRPMTVKTLTQTVEIPLNSVLGLHKGSIRFFRPAGGRMVYHAIAGLEEESEIVIGEHALPYQELLRNLSVIGEETADAEEQETTSEDSEKKNKKEKQPGKKTAAEAGSAVETGKEGTGSGNVQGEGNVVNSGEQGPVFVAPTVELSDFTSTVYAIDSQIVVQDPQKCLTKGRVELQIWKEGRLYMRKYYKKNSQVHIGNLEPDMKYTIKTVYSYTDEDEQLVEKTLADKEIRTKSVDTMESLSLSYKEGGRYAEQMELKELTLANRSSSEAVQGLSRIVIEIEDEQFVLNAVQMAELKSGRSVDYISSARLTPDKEDIPFEFHAYDRLGNELKLAGGKGTVTTCKKAPEVAIKVVSNKVSDVKLRVTLTKESEIEIKDYYMLITMADSGEVLKKESLDQSKSEEEFSFEDLDANKALEIKVYGTFDTEDGSGERTEILAEGRVVTVPLSSLGYISTITTLNDVQAHEADLSLRVNKTQTDERLLKLLHSLTVHITDQSGQEIITKELKDEEAEALRSGADVPVHLKDLQSAHNYEITVTGKVKHGTSIYEHRVSNNLNKFKTNRQDAVIQIREKEVRQGVVRFQVRAVDVDGAVRDGYVGLKVTSNNHKVIDVRAIDTIKNAEEEEAGWVSYELDGLGVGDSYFFRFYAQEYNVGFTNATRVMNYEFPESFDVLIPSGIEGEMSLKNMKNASEGKMDVSLKYKITDVSHKIEGGKFYFDVYEEDGTRYDSFEYPMLGDGIVMDDNIQPAVLSLPRDHEYRIELRVTDMTVPEKPEKLILDSIQVDTKVPVKEIGTPEEFYQVSEDPSGHYVVVADLDCIADTEMIQKTFRGQIDFQGHTVKFRASNERPYLFYQNNGTLKNVVLETGFRDSEDVESVSGFVQSNGGIIENIIVNFAESTVGAAGNHKAAGVIYQNAAKGEFRNFAINANASLPASHLSSYGIAINEGKVYNGYVQGQPIDATYPNPEYIEYSEDGGTGGGWETTTTPNSFKNVGGIVGRNAASGLVEEVYSVADVYRGTLVPDEDHGGTMVTRIDEASTGSIIGRNEGVMRNGYTYVTADPAESDTNSYQYGPAIGRNAPVTKTNADTYYTSEKNYGDVRLNKKVSKLQLNDLDFHNHTINKIDNGFVFDAENYVLMGYYPHILLPDSMPRQEMIPLPEVDESEAVDIKSIEVVESDDNSAVINLVLNNPGMGDVKSIKVKDIKKVEILSQNHDLRYTNVQIRVSEPEKYLSEYDFASVTIKNNYTSGRDITRTYSEKEKTFQVEFYRGIENTTEWDAYVVKDGTENYKLQADLNFKGVEDKFVYVPKLDGVLNGNGHTLSNINFKSGDGVNETGVIALLGGEVRNLKIKNMTGGHLNAFIHKTDAQKVTAIDNVYLEDVTLVRNGTYTGALLGYGYGTIVTNCGANRVKIDPIEGNTQMGGLIGVLHQGGTVRNCFITNLDMKIEGNHYYYGAGGLIGLLNGTMSHCYSHGKIISDTGNIGGLVAEINNAAVSRVSECYAAVDIDIIDQWTTHTAPAAGIAAIGSQTIDTLDNVLSLGDLNTTKYGTEPKRIGVNINANNAKLMNAYAAKEQRINGTIREGDVPANAQIRELLTYEQLTDPATYTGKVGLGAEFDYTSVSAGYLPKLYYAGTTELLPGQVDIPLVRGEGSVRVTGVSVNSGATDSTATMVFDLVHSPEYQVDSIAFKGEELEVVRLTQQPKTAQTSSLIVDVKAKKFYDSYILEKINDVTVDTKVDQIFYKWISNISDWNAIDANSYENYKIINDLQFDANSSRTMKRNLKVNRMIGPSPEKPATISGVTLKLDGDKIAADSANVIQEVRTEFGNLKVEDFSITTLDEDATSSKYNSTIAFVAFYDANIHDLEITGMRINDGVSYYRGQGVGFFGRNAHSWSTGMADNIRIRDVRITGNTYVGAFSGDQKANGQLRNVYASDIHVKGNNGYIGGLAGYGYIYYGVLEDSSVYNECPTSTSYTGGMIGSGHVQYSSAKNCEVTTVYTGPSTQATPARYTGGLTGAGGVIYSYAEQTTVNGEYHVGGLSGYHAGYNPAYNNYVVGGTITGTNNVGGIYGIGHPTSEGYRFQNSGVLDSTVTGVNNVGGIGGIAYGDQSGFFVRGTTVTASGNGAGGIAGQYNGLNPHKFSDNSVEANVSAAIGSAGGIVGTLEFKGDARGENALELNNNLYTGIVGSNGGVTAGTNAGGMVGEMKVDPSKYPKQWNGNILLGSVTAPNTSPSVGNLKWGGDGLPQEKTVNMKIYAKAEIGGLKAEEYDAWKEECIVGQKELSDPAFYTGLGYKDYVGVNMPAVAQQTTYYWKYDPTGATLPNVALGYSTVKPILVEPAGYKVYGKDQTNKDRYSVLPEGAEPAQYQIAGEAIQTQLPVPSENVKARLFQMEEGDKLPKTEVYTSGIDSLNIEFDHTGESLYFYLKEKPEIQYPIDTQLVTFTYDFAEPFTIVLSNGAKEREIQISPAAFTRRVLTYGDTYYYIKGEGVVCGDEGLIEGDFLHLYDGKALTRTGEVIDLSSGQTLESVTGVRVENEAKPLWSFEIEGAEVTSYGSVSSVGEDTTRPMQLFAKDDVLGALDGGLDTVKDSLIFDTYQEEDYQTVLGKDGRIYDLKDRIHTPEDFVNGDIKYMTHNLNSTSHYVLFEYNTGTVAGFDYVTGEMIFEEKVESQMSFLEFAKSFFDFETPSLSEDAPEVYKQIEVLADRLSKDPIESIIDGKLDGNAGGSLPDSADGSEESSSGEASGGVAQNEEVQNAFLGGAGYVPFYDGDTNEYVLYSAEELLDQEKEKVQTENAKIQESEELKEFYQPPATSMKLGGGNRMGILIIGGFMAAAIGAVIYLMTRKKKY